MRKWYVVRTKTGQENRVFLNLEKQGFECYLPRYRRRIRHARKASVVMRPLFPGYAFVNLDFQTERWRSVDGTFGAIGFVRFGDCPASVPDGLITTFRDNEDHDGAIRMGGTNLRIGDQVRILDGPFADRLAVLIDASEQDRVVLLLDLLAREVRVRVSSDILAKVS